MKVVGPSLETVLKGERENRNISKLHEELAKESQKSRIERMRRPKWTLIPEGTVVTIVCEDVPSGISKEDHDAGLKSSLKNLAHFVEEKGE